MAFGTGLSRLSGLLRISALSFAVGVTPLADAYNLANTTPNMIYDLLIGGVLSATLVPVFVMSLETQDAARARDGICAVLSLAVVVSVLAAVLMVVAAPALVRAYTVANSLPVAGTERAVATQFVRLFAPQVACYALISMFTALLNVQGRFAAPTFVPIVNNVVVTAVLLFVGLSFSNVTLGSASGHLLLVLGAGTTAGVAAQALALVPALRRCELGLRWRWAPSDPAVRQVVRLSGWLVGIVIANQVALFVVLLLANSEPGGVTAYTYAYSFFQLPYGVVAVSIMTARQPRWASSWSTGRPAELWRDAVSGLRLLWRVILPLAALLAVAAVPLLELLLQHGHTTAAGARLAGEVLAILALGLPGFSAYLYAIRMYQAMQNTRSAFGLYLAENGANVAVAVALYRPAGVRGVAASVVVAYTAAAMLAWWRLRRRLAAGSPARLQVDPDLTAPVLALVGGGLAALAEQRLGTGVLANPAAEITVAFAVIAAGYVIVEAGGKTFVRAKRRRRANRDSRNGPR